MAQLEAERVVDRPACYTNRGAGLALPPAPVTPACSGPVYSDPAYSGPAYSGPVYSDPACSGPAVDLPWLCSFPGAPGVVDPRRHVLIPKPTFAAMSALNPKRSSNSRTSNRPPSEVTREPWKSTFQTRIKRELKGLILFLTHWVEPP